MHHLSFYASTGGCQVPKCAAVRHTMKPHDLPRRALLTAFCHYPPRSTFSVALERASAPYLSAAPPQARVTSSRTEGRYSGHNENRSTTGSGGDITPLGVPGGGGSVQHRNPQGHFTHHGGLRVSHPSAGACLKIDISGHREPSQWSLICE